MHIPYKNSKLYYCAWLSVFEMNRVQTDVAPQQPPVQFGDRPRCRVLQTYLVGMLPGTGSCFTTDHVSPGRFLGIFWDKQSFLLTVAFAALWTLTLGLPNAVFPWLRFFCNDNIAIVLLRWNMHPYLALLMTSLLFMVCCNSSTWKTIVKLPLYPQECYCLF